MVRLFLRFSLLSASALAFRTSQDGQEGWDLWSDDQSKCDLCADVLASKLKPAQSRDYHVGCLNTDTYHKLPFCKVDSEFKAQAGGHVGDFFVVEGGHVAKKVAAAEASDPCKDGRREDCRRQKAGFVEYATYMQFWCLKRFREKSAAAMSTSKGRAVAQSKHPMDPFVVGPDPWAPDFFGICKRVDESETGLYIVMENLMAGYKRPSQLDLKVGVSYEHKAISNHGLVPGHVAAKMIDKVTPTRVYKARVAGYKVWLPDEKKYRKMWKKSISPMMDLGKVFNRLFEVPGRGNDAALLEKNSNTVTDMAMWWSSTGVHEVRSVSASILFIYEGDPTAPQKSTVKFIDYAHFFPRGDVLSWPDDGVTLGLFAAVSRMDRLRKLIKDKKGQPNLAQSKAVCGEGESCKNRCNNQTIFAPVHEDRCIDIGKRMQAKFITWRSKNRFPRCEVCDDLEERRFAGKIYKVGN